MTRATRTFTLCGSCRRKWLWRVTVGFFIVLVCPRCDEATR